MTIALLALLPLFALLVVTGRPIVSDLDLGSFASTTSAVQTTVQAPLHVHPGKHDLKLDAAHIPFQNPKEQVKSLSEPNAEDIAVIASFEISLGGKPSFEALLYETAGRHDTLHTGNDPDGFQAEHVTEEWAVREPTVEQRRGPVEKLSAAPLVVLAFSCAAAFLALSCIALTVYIIKSLCARILASKTTWELLPRFWKYPSSRKDTSATAKGHFLGGGCLLRADVGQQYLIHVEEGSTERHDLHTENKPLYFDAVSDLESEWDNIGEKYQDALDMTPLLLTHDLPLGEHVLPQFHFDDPALPLGSHLPDRSTGDHNPRVRGSCSSPLNRPVWSIQAVDSPPLGLPPREIGGAGVDSTLQPPIHPRRRAYRSAVPEFDITLAMQLRPGLGLGADSAWMVRFLMTIFGWLAFALTNNVR